MNVSLESVPRKGLLSEEVSSLPSVQRSYISDSARLRSQLVSELVSEYLVVECVIYPIVNPIPVLVT
jgi:hypothetical protein